MPVYELSCEVNKVYCDSGVDLEIPFSSEHCRKAQFISEESNQREFAKTISVFILRLYDFPQGGTSHGKQCGKQIKRESPESADP